MIQSGFDEVTGLIGYRIATVNSQPEQNLAFNWDNLGRLQSRIDYLQSSLTEAFTHDSLDRLTGSTRNIETNLALQYAKNGVISSRDGRTYDYTSGRPYAPVFVVETIDSCNSNQYVYQYDANGNQTQVVLNSSQVLRQVAWTPFDYPATITEATSSATFHYTPDRARWKQVASYGGTSETTRYIGGLLETVNRGTVTEYRHQIPLGASATAIHTRQAGSSPETTWVTRDHLGSGTLVMDESGTPLLNLSFGSFGERRGAAWHDEPTLSDWSVIESTTRRGFTGHEHLDSVNLIHMNGRVYDPWLGQFLSADPVDGNVYLSQRLARYSYVMNSPHAYTDPSGFTMEEIIVKASPIGGCTPICTDGVLNAYLDQHHSDSNRWQPSLPSNLGSLASAAQGGAAVSNHDKNHGGVTAIACEQNPGSPHCPAAKAAIAESIRLIHAALDYHNKFLTSSHWRGRALGMVVDRHRTPVDRLFGRPGEYQISSAQPNPDVPHGRDHGRGSKVGQVIPIRPGAIIVIGLPAPHRGGRDGLLAITRNQQELARINAATVVTFFSSGETQYRGPWVFDGHSEPYLYQRE